MIVVLHKPKYAALSRQTQAQKPGIQLLRVLATACLACPACPCCCPCVLCASQQFLGSINRSSYTHQKFEKKKHPSSTVLYMERLGNFGRCPRLFPSLHATPTRIERCCYKAVTTDNGIYFVLGVCASIILVGRSIQGHNEFQRDCTDSVDPTQCSAKSV